jgi:hypothetical protein
MKIVQMKPVWIIIAAGLEFFIYCIVVVYLDIHFRHYMWSLFLKFKKAFGINAARR